MPCRGGEWMPQRWCLRLCGQGPAERDTLSPHVCVFASLTDQVREKKDVPLGPEDPKEEDGSFDYRWVVSLAPVGTQCPLSGGCPRCPEQGPALSSWRG